MAEGEVMQEKAMQEKAMQEKELQEKVTQEKELQEEMMKATEKLGVALDAFDLLLFFPDDESKTLLDEFCSSEALRNTSKRVLILSDADISGRCRGSYEYCSYNEYGGSYEYGGSNEYGGSYKYHQLSAKEQEALKCLYLTYEFSDRFLMIADNPQYGGLLNYVKTGGLTMDETFEAILE